MSESELKDLIISLVTENMSLKKSLQYEKDSSNLWFKKSQELQEKYEGVKQNG